MSRVFELLNKVAPDIRGTFLRFPVAIFLLGLSTILFIARLNNLLTDVGEFWFRLGLGLYIGAIFSVAGVLFARSAKRSMASVILVSYIFPLAAIVILQVEATDWVVSLMLAPIAILWLSLAAFVGSSNNIVTDYQSLEAGQTSQNIELQNRF